MNRSVGKQQVFCRPPPGFKRKDGTVMKLKHSLYGLGTEAGSSCNAESLGILVYLVIYDSGQVSLEHLLLSWYPSGQELG